MLRPLAMWLEGAMWKHVVPDEAKQKLLARARSDGRKFADDMAKQATLSSAKYAVMQTFYARYREIPPAPPIAEFYKSCVERINELDNRDDRA
jgi:hypothetical protein